MRKNWLIILATAIAIVFFAGATGIAGKGHKGYGGHGKKSGHHGLRGFLELKLTEAQQAEVAKIIDKYHEQKYAVKSRMWDAKEKVTEAIYADTYDETAIRKATQDVSSIKEELSILRAKMYQELKTVLSPEQVEQFREMKSYKHGHKGCK